MAESCTKEITSDDYAKSIVGKWKPYKQEEYANGKLVDVYTDENATSFILFTDSGLFYFDTAYSAKYTISSSLIFLRADNGGTRSMMIHSLTKKELVLDHESGLKIDGYDYRLTYYKRVKQ